MNLASARHAWRLVLFQLSVTLIAFPVLIIPGWMYAWSGLAVADRDIDQRVLRFGVRSYRAQEPGKLLGRFYGAEVQKPLLTGLLFAVAILWLKPLSAGALFRSLSAGSDGPGADCP